MIFLINKEDLHKKQQIGIKKSSEDMKIEILSWKKVVSLCYQVLIKRKKYSLKCLTKMVSQLNHSKRQASIFTIV